MKSKNYPLSFILLLLSLQLVAQQFRGKVTDQDNTPLVGAHILNSQSGSHAHADVDGKFTLDQYTLGDTLIISYIGYHSGQYVTNKVNENHHIKLDEKNISLDAIVIKPGLTATNMFTDIDLQINPVKSSQEILQTVPGLFISQHAGGGKAEQIFLRGFDLDHGTDIQITVDGLPVNMVSHAHGQGYSDLHFVIPELVDNVDFAKGPYYADKGNFSTAASVDFNLKESVDDNLVKAELGQFGHQRLAGVFNVMDVGKHKAYIASELLFSDGPFESPQNLSRTNIFGRYVLDNQKSKIIFTASHFNSTWDASGQIPWRAVNDGSITRFGAIDDTEGGTTSRTNVSLDIRSMIDANSFINNKFYFSKYDFNLYSNFTFFLNDPVNGDQIRQHEDRSILGFQTDYSKSISWGPGQLLFKHGIGLRYDNVDDNILSRTKLRFTNLGTIRDGDVAETNFYAFSSAQLEWSQWLINLGLRYEYFKFGYIDKMNSAYDLLSANNTQILPKLNVIYSPSSQVQLYFKAGKSFHSNDSRVVLDGSELQSLPSAWGTDIGTIWKPIPRVMINTALWYLRSDQEFIYVGDEGIVEPNGRTERKGVDLSLRYQISKYWFSHLDATYSHARTLDDPEGQNFIPLAPDKTLTAGIDYKSRKGLYGGIRLKYLSDRPGIEDNSIQIEGFNIVDANLGYQKKNFDISIAIQNLFDSEWAETQFVTESRLANEPEPVEEIHFIPGTPFNIRTTLAVRF